jgi:hypothetical protein
MRNNGVGSAQHLQVDEKALWLRKQKHPTEFFGHGGSEHRANWQPWCTSGVYS